MTTPVGTLEGAWNTTVDPRGLVTSGGWSLDWWIGADDRWHVPAVEVAVRQRLVDDLPVVETAMRVPSGDVVHRVYAVPGRIVVELENQSPVPVALVLVVRDAGRIALDGTTVLIDGEVGLSLPKPPARVAGSADGDVSGVVQSGEAGTELAPLRSRRRRATAAFVWPLAHRQTMRFALGGSLDGTPSLEQVANGWRAHDRGVRLVLPDARLQSAVDANRRFLLGRRDVAGAVALLRWGQEREAAELAKELVLEIAAEAERAARRGGRLDGAAELLRLAGEDRAAEDAERLGGASEPPSFARLNAMLDEASSTWTWSDPAVAPTFLALVRDLLARETDDGLALCSTYPDAWLGQGLEVHDLPTRHGLLSFAIRWHGDRPALLWELDGDARITAPGLDPTWSSTDRRGDALLAPVLPPGTPVTLRRA